MKSLGKKDKLILEENSSIALVYRGETVQAVSMAKKVSEFLKERGYAVYTAPEQKLIPVN